MRDTSVAAAQSIAGGAEQLRARVLAEIATRGGATCDEVEVALDLRHQTASARVNELAEEGKIADSGARRKTRSGREAIVWVVTSAMSLASPLIWLGAKRWLVPRLAKLYDPHWPTRVVEPFMGSLTVTLGIRPVDALLRDANPHLVNFWQWAQHGLTVRMRMENEERFYYSVREHFNNLLRNGETDTQEAAEFFYYLNRTCFNGVVRFNREGLFNVPFGRRKKINYRTDFREFVEPMRGWAIEYGDFESTPLVPGDFIYLDPPYDCEFTEYNGVTFTWEQQVRVVEKFAVHNGPVVISNAATARIINLYRRHGFAIEFVASPRSVAADVGKRGAVLEVLATKNC